MLEEGAFVLKGKETSNMLNDREDKSFRKLKITLVLRLFQWLYLYTSDF